MPVIPLAGDRQVSLHLHVPKTVTRLTEQGMVSFRPTRVGDSPLCLSSPGKCYLPFSRNTVSPKSHLVWRFLKIYFDIMSRTFLPIKLMGHGLWNHKDEGLWSDSLLKALILGWVGRWSFPGRSVLGMMCAKRLQGHSQCSVHNGNKFSEGTMLEQFAFHPGPNKYTVSVGGGRRSVETYGPRSLGSHSVQGQPCRKPCRSRKAGFFHCWWLVRESGVGERAGSGRVWREAGGDPEGLPVRRHQ